MTTKLLRIPFIEVEEDGDTYFAPKYLGVMQMGFGIREDNRVENGTGVFSVVGDAGQFAFLEAQEDVELIEVISE